MKFAPLFRVKQLKALTRPKYGLTVVHKEIHRTLRHVHVAGTLTRGMCSGNGPRHFRVKFAPLFRVKILKALTRPLLRVPLADKGIRRTLRHVHVAGTFDTRNVISQWPPTFQSEIRTLVPRQKIKGADPSITTRTPGR